MVRRFIRARSPEQKQARRAQLLDTARALLVSGVDLRDLSLNELARQTGVAKANVYRYFESREAVLLALLRDELIKMQAKILPLLQPGRRETASLDAVVRVLARSLAGEPLLCALTAAVPSVLEQNLSEEALRAYKRESLASLAQVAELLEHACPALPALAYRGLLQDAMTAIVAVYPMTHPGPVVASAIAAADLQFYRRDFAHELERFLRALAHDYAARRPTKRGRANGRAAKRHLS